ncbi:MAG: GntR family transcriptional regulator [Gemmatimonadaceae bacterium]|nr:GntR family transcriptional regulator [Gemmatimonadaceae bacterium]
MILNGDLPAGSALTENAIVERIEIGKTPVREAMRRLVLEGLLAVTPRLGYTVTPITLSDAEDLFQLRCIVEVAAVELASPRLGEPELQRLEELSTIGYDPGDRESIMVFSAANAEFHEIIAVGSGNRRLAELALSLMQESRRFIQAVTLTDDHGRLVQQQHCEIVAALRDRDPEAAAAAVRQHLDDSRLLTVASLSQPVGSAV